MFRVKQCSRNMFVLLVAWLAASAVVFTAVNIAKAQCGPNGCPTRQSWEPQQQSKMPQARRSQPRQEARPSQPCPYPAIVIVDFLLPGNSSEMATGSGFIADRNKEDGSAIVVTCAHGYKAMMTVHVRTQDRRTFAADVLGVEATQDLCILRIADPGIKPLNIAEEAPEIGDRVFMAGFAKGKYFLGKWGSMSKWVSPSSNGDPTFLETTCQSIEGCSGGPILNTQGRVVATVTGNAGGCIGPCLSKTLPLVKLDDGIKFTVSYTDSVLPWRKEVEKVDKAQSAAINQIQSEVSARPAAPCCPATPVVDQAMTARIAVLEASLAEKEKQAASKPETLREKIHDKIEAVKEKGLFRRLHDQCDGFDAVGVLVLMALGISVYAVVKRGGVHTIVEGKRSQIEEDAAGDGLRAKLAQRLLAVHDGEVGDKLAILEAKLGSVSHKADFAVQQSQAVADQIAPVASVPATTAT